MSEVAIIIAKHGGRRDHPGLKDALYLPLNKLSDEIERCFFESLLIPLPKPPKASDNGSHNNEHATSSLSSSSGGGRSGASVVPSSSSPSHPYNFFVFWDLLERCEFRADCPHIRFGYACIYVYININIFIYLYMFL